MAAYTAEQLGRAVRNRRSTFPLTQQALGERAGYGAGAGVSVSRIEAGITTPTRSRLEGIARALDTTVDTLEREAAGLDPGVGAGDERTSQGRAPGESLKQFARRLEAVVAERVDAVTTAGAHLDAAHAQARDRFFLPFVQAAGPLDAPDAPPEPHADRRAADDQAGAQLRTAADRVRAGLGAATGATAAAGAAAYTSFVAASAPGSATTGALVALGSGSLATGGLGIAGGTALLSTVVAAPIALLGVGGLVWIVRRNRKQEAELATRLATLATELEATERGFDAALEIVHRSTDLLEYIGVHAGHAVGKWSRALGPGRTFADLPADARERYQAFARVAACQLAVVAIDSTTFMTLRGADLDEYAAATRALVDRATDEVESLV